MYNVNVNCIFKNIIGTYLTHENSLVAELLTLFNEFIYIKKINLKQLLKIDYLNNFCCLFIQLNF